MLLLNKFKLLHMHFQFFYINYLHILYMTHIFRNYDNAKQQIINTYKKKHENQTFDYVISMVQKYCNKLNENKKMNIWNALLLSNNIIDESDPDINVEQINHAFQVAEKLRTLYPNDEQLHLVGLLHDLGKILLLPEFGGLDQWEVVGDIYPVGCAFNSEIIYSEFFINHKDMSNHHFNTKYGIYKQNFGLDNIQMCWSHDEYLYHVLKNNINCKLEEKYLKIIRYHSFYAFHKNNAYEYLVNDDDMKLKPLLQLFSQCDLYTKSDDEIDIKILEPYYKTLIDKYCDGNYYW